MRCGSSLVISVRLCLSWIGCCCWRVVTLHVYACCFGALLHDCVCWFIPRRLRLTSHIYVGYLYGVVVAGGCLQLPTPLRTNTFVEHSLTLLVGVNVGVPVGPICLLFTVIAVTLRTVVVISEQFWTDVVPGVLGFRLLDSGGRCFCRCGYIAFVTTPRCY